jgi:hypothetical protein
MYGITRGHLLVSQDDLFGTLYNAAINRQHLINNAEQGVERWLDGVAAVDGDVAVKNLLEDFGISHETLAFAD